MPPNFKPNLYHAIGSYGHMHTRLNEVKTVTNIDVLFLGSSHAYRGFDTRIYKEHGLYCFNLGSSAQTPTQTLVLLKRYLDKLNPKLVVYEVYHGSFSVDGIESALDIIANDKNDMHSFQMALSLNHPKVYNAFIYSVIHDVFSLNKNFTEPQKKGNDIYISGGYVEKEISFYSPISLPNTNISVKTNQLKAIYQIINKLKNKETPVILIYAPIAPSNYNRYDNITEFNSIMSLFADYYNYNEKLFLNDSLHFYDSHHLNQYGVEAFNKELVDLIIDKLSKKP